MLAKDETHDWEALAVPQFLIKLLYSAATILILNICHIAQAETLTLRMTETNEGTSKFYHELLLQSLASNGHTLKIINMGDRPQKRSVVMFENGQLDIIWLLKSKERSQKYIDVNVNLTSGLMGQRVLFVPPDTKTDYAKVKTLDDFRNLEKIGAFGANWFDEKVWLANNLLYYVVDGEWRSIYERLLKKNSTKSGIPFDYFSRSVIEIVIEAKHHPNLAIEPHLLFQYDRDFHFYLNNKSAHLKPIIEDALKKAAKSGLQKQLINKHFSTQLRSLSLDKRTLISLYTPE
ncbi:hypothetical protein [Kiloniella sp.]|uniref:hypothetical protein n=1 Tax=Kiloniella sp. TaxID=1938587 RepID=UPI003B01FA4C